MTEINRAEALMPHAKWIYQVIANVYALHRIGAVTGIPFNYSWPDRETIIYDRSPEIGIALPQVVLTNVRPSGLSQIGWGTEEVLSSHTEDTIITEVNLPEGADFDQEISHKFGAVKTLLEASKTAFETQVAARLGSDTSPAALRLQETITAEFSRQFGTENTHEQLVKQRISLKGPRHFRISAIRETQNVRRQCRTAPHFDFGIRVRQLNNQVIAWNSLSEFIESAKGLAPDEVGFAPQRNNWPAFSFSAIARRSPQPNIQAPPVHAADILASPDYQNVTRQTIEVVDVE